MSHSTTNVRSAGSASDHLYPWRWYLSDLDKVEKNGLKVFSCFSCGGGSSMGYKLAGFDVIGCCEIDPAMMKVYQANNHPKHPYLMDIRNFVKYTPLPEELYHLDILDGSPPCSVFSMAGSREEGWNREKTFREGQKKQRLDDLFFHFIAVADRLKPKVVIAENVKGLMLGNAKGYVNEIFKAFYLAGYDVQMFLLNSSRMGVPQERERVVFVARRKDLSLPALKLKVSEPVIPFGAVRSARGDPVGDGLARYMMELRQPTDRSIADISQRTRRKRAGYSNPINRDEEPVHTIISGGSLFRMCDGLKMTKEDIVNCQTFPQDYDFLDQSPQYVCGMSVPPVMMAHVAHAVAEQWLGGEKHGEA